MQQLKTNAIILRRTNYGEADRIITVITPEQGKLSLVAKGVRKIKSKLAGGIELFSVSQITYIPPRTGSGLGTLVSARLVKHYGKIVQEIDRTMQGYDLIKQLDKVTEDSPEPQYFELLERTFAALDDLTVSQVLIGGWYRAQLLTQAGHSPNLETDDTGNPLQADLHYEFRDDEACFVLREDGSYGVAEIKFLRLLFSGAVPQALARVQGGTELADKLQPILRTLCQYHLAGTASL